MAKLNVMYFFVEDDDFMNKYNTTRDTVSLILKKEFDSEPVYKKIF